MLLLLHGFGKILGIHGGVFGGGIGIQGGSRGDPMVERLLKTIK